MLTIEKAIDSINDVINTRDKNQYGVDIGLQGARALELQIEELYTVGGNVMTCEAIFDDLFCFCWGETAALHRAWVNSH